MCTQKLMLQCRLGRISSLAVEIFNTIHGHNNFIFNVPRYYVRPHDDGIVEVINWQWCVSVIATLPYSVCIYIYMRMLISQPVSSFFLRAQRQIFSIIFFWFAINSRMHKQSYVVILTMLLLLF